MKSHNYDHVVNYLRSCSPEETASANRLEIQRAALEHTIFARAFRQGMCYLCHQPIDAFCESKPCCHWLLNPRELKKKHFPSVFERYGFFQLRSYLGWVASVETPFRNINDLRAEHSGMKKIELTIRWGNLEWSFSSTVSDLRGHKGKDSGSEPHYHLQIVSSGKVILKYNDFHVSFNDEDKLKLYMGETHPELVRNEFAFGEGMELVMSQPIESLVDGMRPIDDPGEATFHLRTIISSKGPDGLPFEDFRAIAEEARQKGVTIASLAHKLGGSVVTMIAPGPGVPRARERRPRRQSKKT